ncbi:hypothetical protein EZ428_23850 [Pedobacter frigiditerrae]|uniref:Uncharacterized protein n=1 Tax=Pedobacter frigiditerrae TaxID=2530452 RepID=A0A4R0MIV5_9SPHI|nr:hypothetical protein [Pedobacter frigiditerrae]TCC86500.1 hypothetical protein EZ428_23850 [Pedobacter frigiditerrae]
MNNDNEELKPLSFDENEDGLMPMSFGTGEEAMVDSIPLVKTATNEIKNRDSNFVFFFGNPQSGKSVILSSMLYHLSSQAGVLRPKIGTPNSHEAQTLLYDFYENIRQGILPERTTVGKVLELDLVFEPNNKSKKVMPINLTFLEASGEDLRAIKRGGNFNSHISKYLSSNVPLTFIIVTSYDTADKDDALINEFLDELERKGKNLRPINLILVISKWDKSGRMEVESEEELDNFINDNLRRTSQRINAYELSKTFYTIGNVETAGGSQRVTLLSLDTAGILSNWLYNSITGFDINYEGTFLERLKWSLFN